MSLTRSRFPTSILSQQCTFVAEYQHATQRVGVTYCNISPKLSCAVQAVCDLSTIGACSRNVRVWSVPPVGSL